MTNPRRPDDQRLSTADLARASERAAERPIDAQGERPVARPDDRPIEREVAPASAPVADARMRAQQAAQAQQPQRAQQAEQVRHAQAQAHEQERPTPMFAGNETEEFRHRWADIQTGFVDEPRQAVEQADALVAAAIKRLAEVFAHERSNLEQQWARGGDVSTEDLRVALKRYRGFFDRLLSV